MGLVVWVSGCVVVAISCYTPADRHAKTKAKLRKYIMDVNFTVEEESRFSMRLDLTALTQGHGSSSENTGSQRSRLNLQRLWDHQHHPSAQQTNSKSPRVTEFWIQWLTIRSDHRNLFGRPGSQDEVLSGKISYPPPFNPGPSFA